MNRHLREEAGVEPQPVSSGASVAQVSPSVLIETTFDFARSCILLAAVELDLFTWVARGARTSGQLAERAAVDESALTKLLGSLCAMQFLLHTEQGYELTPVAERFLVRDRKTYIGDVVLQIRQEWEAWIRLTDVVRTGTSVRCINEEAVGGPFFAFLDPLLFPIVYPLMYHICERLGIGTSRQALRVADLGAGAAPAAIAALELDRQSSGVVIDFAEVLPVARKFARARGVEERLTFLAEDLEQISLPEACFDVIFAGHIFRLLGPSVTRRLLGQIFASLKPGGSLVVVETYNDPERATVLFPHIVSLNMLVNTRQGEALVSHHMHRWLTDAGFQVETWTDSGPDRIFIGRR